MANILKALRSVVINVGVGLAFLVALTFIAGAIYYVHRMALIVISLLGVFICFIVGAIIRRVDGSVRNRTISEGKDK